jgi:hypothetical protein
MAVSTNVYDKLVGFFKDKNGNVAIAQWPNIPIVGWLLFKLAAMLATSPQLESGFITKRRP